jgi:hypothetical protein
MREVRWGRLPPWAIGNIAPERSAATAREAYRQAGVNFLIDQSKTLDVGGAPLALVGLDDALLGSPNLTQARSGVRRRPHPRRADPPSGPPPVKPLGAGRFLEGWYRDTLAPLYVSRGVGTTGIPARFRCPAELPIFTLRPAS